jgi:tetratricopeptide (TPR) repeat protein
LAERVAHEVREELAECLVKQSHFDDALQVLEALSPSVQEAPKLQAFRAECLFGVGRFAEALALLEKALTAYPDSADLLRTRGKRYVEEDQPAKAVPLLERALALDRHDYVSRHQLAQAYERLGRSGDAKEQRRLLQQTQDYLTELTGLNQEVTTKPWDAALRRRLADVCQKLGRPELAAIWLRAAAICPPGSADGPELKQAGTPAEQRP